MIFGGLEKMTLIDYPGKIACMVYTIGCNFRCPYCHNPELVDETVETKISEAEVFAFLERRKTMLDAVVITGGEPTMHGQKLLNFIHKIKAMGFLVKLDSNGTNPDFLKKAIEQGLVDYIAMDIKSPLSKYSQTVARPVDVAAIRKSIHLLILLPPVSPIKYEFRTTVVKSMLSHADFEEIGREIRGAHNYFLQKFVPTKILNPQFMKKVTYSDHEFEIIRKQMNRYVKNCSIRS